MVAGHQQIGEVGIHSQGPNACTPPLDTVSAGHGSGCATTASVPTCRMSAELDEVRHMLPHAMYTLASTASSPQQLRR